MRDVIRGGSQDLKLAAALAGAGVASLAWSIAHGWNAQEMNPGIEGTLTVGVGSALFAVLHGIEFPKVVALHVPIFASLVASCWAVRGPAIPVAGMAMLALALFGAARAVWRADAPSARTAPSQGVSHPSLWSGLGHEGAE